MIINFVNSKDRKLYQTKKELVKKHGEQLQRKITRRITELEQLPSVGLLLHLRLGKAHWLDHNYKGHIGISLTGNYRLVIKPMVEDAEQKEIDWNTIENIMIMEVVDYHGN